MNVERNTPSNSDPYAPPPRHKERSGAVVRVLILGALLAGAAWGYMEYGQGDGQSLVAEQTDEQMLADTGLDAPVTPQSAPAPLPEPADAPAQTPAPEPVGAAPAGR
jgi:hypothetical protein